MFFRKKKSTENKNMISLENVYLVQTLIVSNLDDESGFGPRTMNMYFLAQNTIEYINDHFNENITLNELADMNYITPGYLSSVFKKATGFNISNFIQTRRLIHAKNLLCETDDSISVISEKCGFNDSNYFSVVFKKYTSQSPLQYRKTHS